MVRVVALERKSARNGVISRRKETSMQTGETTTIILSRDEALVLDDLLSKVADQPTMEIAHPAQRRALQNLACLIEKELVETFKPDYKERLEIAKKNLTDSF
jgi:hypothetical protein